MWRSFLGGLLDLIYPPSCLLCGESPHVVPKLPLFSWQASLCERCIQELTRQPHPVCPRCAAPIGPHALVAGGCSRCRERSFGFECLLSLGPYDGVLRAAVLRMKHRSGEGLAELLGEMWGEQQKERFRAVGAEVLVPVPLHWLRRLQRGYNQSAALGLGLAKALHLPVATGILHRVRRTPHQAYLPLGARADNIRGAFRAQLPAALCARSLLLLDDVSTSTATLHEAARTLRAAGARRVVAAALARA